jgi:hypothetical protein
VGRIVPLPVDRQGTTSSGHGSGEQALPDGWRAGDALAGW